MHRTLLAAILLGALFAASAQAQAPQKPEVKSEAAKPEAAKPEPGPGQEPDPKIIEDIMTCLAQGLPTDWKRTWFVITQIGSDASGKSRDFAVVFFYATSDDDKKGKIMKTCDADEIVAGVGRLNAYLPESQQRWSGAKFTFYRDGRYDVAYDQSPFKPRAKPAAKPAAKKKQETAK